MTINSSYNVREFGAVGDGAALDHPAIQGAIDAAAAQGGGTVFFPAGSYLCGTIRLRSHVHLDLGIGAVIIGSPNPDDYSIFEKGKMLNDNAQPIDFRRLLIVGDAVSDIAITGHGTIDGNGTVFYEERVWNEGGINQGKSLYLPKECRPCGSLMLLGCSNVRLDGFAVKDSPCFAVHVWGCRNIQVRGLRITSDKRFHTSDGIHVVSSQHMTISDCLIDSEDDALAFYTNWAELPGVGDLCAYITVTNCVLSAKCCGIRIGYAGRGEIRDMTFSNLSIYGTNRGIDFMCTRFNVHAQAQQLPGDQIRNLRFSNIVINGSNWGITANVDGPHLLEEVRRGWPNTPRAVAVESPVLPAGINNLLFSGLSVTSKRGNYLHGSDTSPLRDITFRDVRFSIIGELKNAVHQVPEPLDLFSGANIPYGLFVRHSERVDFQNCTIDMSAAKGEWKQGFLAEKSPTMNATPEIISNNTNT